MYNIVTVLNWTVTITKQNEKIPSLQGVISKNRPSPIENWDVFNACTQMYKFWEVFIQVYLAQKRARITQTGPRGPKKPKHRHQGLQL